MNGGGFTGGIPYGMAGGGYTGYAPLAVPAVYAAPTVPTLAGDISALTSPSYEFTFDPLAPLDTTGFVFAPEPTPAVSPLPTITSQIEPGKFGAYAEQPVVYAAPIEVVQPAPGLLQTAWEAPGNLIKFAGDLIATGVDTLIDTGKFILEHLEAGLATGMAIGGGVAPTIKTVVGATETVESAISTVKSIPDSLADWLAGLTGVPSEATPPFVETGSIGVQAPTNWALLGLLGVGAYLLLKGR